MTKPKQILILAFAVILFVLLVGFVSARKTEITYPIIEGFESITPTQTTDFLPDYIKYIFTFAIVISAIVAFGSFVYGGIRWLISAGSSSALSDAKDRMKAGAIGLVVILSSWVILNTINPQLVTISPTVPVKWGIALYTDSVCTQNKKEITRNTDPIDLGGLNYTHLKFNDDVPKYSLEVKINNNDAMIFKNEADPHPCQAIGAIPISIEFIWKLPGVYLVKNDANNTEKFLPASTATLGDFNDAVKGVRFNNIENVSFGTVLHEDQYWKSTCEVFLNNDFDLTSGNNNMTGLPNTIGLKTSSVTTFPWTPYPGPGGVTFYTDDNFNGTPSSVFQNAQVPDVRGQSIQDNTITSLRISGNYIAVLFENTNYSAKCQVFTNNDSNLRDDEIGRCGCGPFGWGCSDCLSSFIVLPTR